MVTFTGVRNATTNGKSHLRKSTATVRIPYAIYNYTAYTGDESYLAEEGLEVLSAVSRFLGGPCTLLTKQAMLHDPWRDRT